MVKGQRSEHWSGVDAGKRHAAAAIELALVLPILLTVFVASVDFARVFYNTQMITDCAHTTALFAANPDLADKTAFEAAAEIGQRCVQELNPPPRIEIVNHTEDEAYPYVEVTVTQAFTLVSPLAFRAKYKVKRTARARLYPAAVKELEDNG